MSKRTQLEIQFIGDDEEEEIAYAVTHSTVSVSGRFSCSKRSKRRVSTGNSRQQGMLNSNLFSDCFENIWKSFSDDRRASFTYLDCLWFSWYMDELYKEKVLAWIRRKHIFSKKYVFVPIVHWSHWNLLIFCNFGELLQSETQTTCMLLLDSLRMSGPRRLEPTIRKFVLDIYEAEKRPERKEVISKIPLLVPKVMILCCLNSVFSHQQVLGVVVNEPCSQGEDQRFDPWSLHLLGGPSLSRQCPKGLVSWQKAMGTP